MVNNHPQKKLQLHGFNNLTKSLCFNMYDVCYASTVAEQKEYLAYVDEEYNAQRLTQILTHCVASVGAHVLNIARQDYEPQGASVTMLVCEDPVDPQLRAQSESVVAHLDKSHICVHTYPEMHPDNGISTFRVDIELSTCGEISPLKALDYLLESFDADVVNIDYRVRGFTRDDNGVKHWQDHEMESIQDYVRPQLLEEYECIDSNVGAERNYHTKMHHLGVADNGFDLDRYVFGGKHVNQTLSSEQRQDISQRLQQEINEIFNARNM